MKAWWSASELAGLPGMPAADRVIRRWGEEGRLQRRPRTLGKGWEYHLDGLPEATRAHLYAEAGEPMSAAPVTPESSSPPSSAPPGATAALAPAALDPPAAVGPSSSPGAAVIQGPWVAEPPAPQAQAAPSAPAPQGQPMQPASAPQTATGPAQEPAAQYLLNSSATADAAPPLVPDLEQLRAYSAERALRLTLRDLQDPAVQARLQAARAVGRAGWGRIGEAIADQARRHGVSEATIRRWCDDVEGWRVRARQPSITITDTAIPVPSSRSFERTAAERGIALYAANMRQGKLAAYRALQAEATESGWRIGDYTSYTRLLGKVSPRIWEAIAKGDIGFELAVAPKIIRAWLSTPAYSVLCGDQNILDYQVVDEATGEIYTPELYLWMDCTSRAWTGLWPAWGHYSRYTVGYSLREACRIATPEEIFTDWGKPELSKYMGQLVHGLRGHTGVGDWDDYRARFGALDGDDGVTHRKTTRVGIPWQKPIENQMNVLKRAFLNEHTPGFRQRLPGAWENDQAQETLKRQRERGELLTTEQYLEKLRDIADAHNREQCSVRESDRPIIPAEVLARGIEEAGRHAFDDLTLDQIFLPRFKRAPYQSTVRVKVAPGDLRHYYAPELSMLARGERVQVSVDPFDPERPAVITTLGGDYMALAEPWHVQQPGDREGLAHKIKRQMQLMRWWREQVKRLRGDVRATPRIGAATKVAKSAAAAEQAKPDRGASKRADDALIRRFAGD